MRQLSEEERLRRLYSLRLAELRLEAPGNFASFLKYSIPRYQLKWFHRVIAEHCQKLLRGDMRNLMVFIPPQHGKALEVHTPVLTVNRGWVEHGDLKPGDMVYSPTGEPVMVEAVTCHYEWECRDVIFSHGNDIIASYNHEWGCYIPNKDHIPVYYPCIETDSIIKIKGDRSPYLQAASPLKNKTKADRSDKLKHFIKNIIPCGIKTVNCIQVQGGYYLAGYELRPTHNSLIISQSFPAWALGNDPDLKIVGTSYSASLAEQFSRSIQRTIDSNEYQSIFPETYLNGSKIRTDVRGYLRNVDFFETVGHRGFYKAVGVGGSLTGTPVDIAIIDDPVKDAMEAYSPVYRERVWEWYTSVLLTRLHNESRQLFIMTRWHEDDLAGRILKHEADKWTVLKIPAIRETLNDGNDFDPRQTGEALWPQKHSLERLLSARQRSARFFSALYQQSPTVEGGNIIRESWFRHISEEDFKRKRQGNELKYPVHFFIDTAYTEKTSNDPTGIIGVCCIDNNLYVTCAEKVTMKFPDLVRHIPEYVRMNGYNRFSSVRIEPKANGLSVIDQLEELTDLNVLSTPTPQESKETRLNAASPFVESGRVYLVEGIWNGEFVTEVCGFPAMPHDEYVDLLGYAIGFCHDDAVDMTDEEIMRLGFL